MKYDTGEAMLQIRVVPRAARNGVQAVTATGVKIRLTAPPVDGKANTALIEFLSEALAVPRQHLLDPPDIDQVGAEPEDHAARPLRRPRTIASRIIRIALSRPPKTASPIRKCPILSSTISGRAAMVSALA